MRHLIQTTYEAFQVRASKGSNATLAQAIGLVSIRQRRTKCNHVRPLTRCVRRLEPSLPP